MYTGLGEADEGTGIIDFEDMNNQRLTDADAQIDLSVTEKSKSNSF